MSIALYAAYQRVLATIPATGLVMEYDWSELPTTMSAVWMPYSQMLSEFSRELANIINAFTNDIRRLQAWAVIIAPLGDAEKLEATREFVEAIAVNAVNLPYVIRSRFAFATAHLCHQANITKDADWKDDLPLDGAIWLDTAGSYAAGWRAWPRLKQVLETIAAPHFREVTGDFRNAYNHRFSPRFVIGLTQFVVRRVDPKTGHVEYGFGGREPMELSFVADLLTLERDRCYAAFDAFQRLVREHEQAILADRGATN